jgi:indole-3-glycerol phosphate synthase
MCSVDSVIEAKQEQLNQRMQKTSLEDLRAVASMQSRPIPFLTHIGNYTAIIGQIRYQLPMTGLLSTRYDPVMQARNYVNAGADAVSLFTDTVIERNGMADMTLVNEALQHSQTPVIGQDFVLHEYHVVEARAGGASVVVLTSGIVSASRLRSLTSAVHRNRMTAVVTVFEEKHIEDALTWSPQVLGLGARTALDHSVDFDFIRHMYTLIPDGQRVMICNPMRSIDEVREAMSIGVDAVMVDKHLLLNQDVKGELVAMLHGA